MGDSKLMKGWLAGRIAKVTCATHFVEDEKTIMVGKVKAETVNYIVLKGRCFQFQDLKNADLEAVNRAKSSVWVLPWTAIKAIEEIPEGTKWDVDCAFADNGDLVLSNKQSTLIAAR
mgnify:CR=1 FL=1